MNQISPLRYPGGKQIIAPILARLMQLNNLEGASYGEAYAGGAGAALSLLFGGHARRIFINDADPAIASLWKAIVFDSQAFAKRILTVDLTVQEWRNQREIYLASRAVNSFELGFAAFYLNRVNRSGIIKNAGPIGGLRQNGPWKIDARFNRKELAERVERIGRYSRRISVSNLDALQFVEGTMQPTAGFTYLDPPYYVKGKELYLNHYAAGDHAEVAERIQQWGTGKWIISYDDVPQIRKLYRRRRKFRFQLSYSVRRRKVGKEIFIASDALALPNSWARSLPR